MAGERTVRINILGQAASAQQAFGDAEKAAESLSAKLGNIGKVAAAGAAVTVAAVTGMGVAAYKLGSSFDSAYDTIAVGTGATGKALKELEADFKAVVANVPADFDTASAAITGLNTLVGATGETLQDLTTSVLNASRMLGEDGVANAEAFGRAMTQWNTPAEEGAELMDDLFRLTQDYGIGLGELIGQLNTYGPVMKNAGFSTEETAELMARLNKEGIAWSRISPGLNASFRRWAEAGKEPREELGRVIEAMQNAETDVEALNLATEAFGAEGAQRMTTAIRNGTFTLDDLGEILGDNAGLVNDLAGETDDLAEKWTLLKNRAMLVFEPIANAVFNLAGTFMDWLLPISERVFPIIVRHLETVGETFSGIPQVVDQVIGRLRGLLDTASVFRNWVGAIITDGDILNDFLTELPNWFQTTIQNIATMMGVGGHNAIVAYAQGIIDGAQTNVQAAIDYVAGLIASYLVGQSPPKAGPLSQIDQAGVNLMTTYTDGMVRGSSGAQAAAQMVATHMDNLSKQMELDAGRAGLEAATGNLEAMERVAADVEGRIQDINGRLRDIDSELLEIDRRTGQINDRYDEQIAPLEEQLELLEKQRDLQAEKLQLETDLQRARIQQAQLEALGDPERRAEIAGELALNELQQQRLDNEEAIADIRAQLEGGDELTDAERERLELRERDLELQRRETQSKLNSDKELTALEKERLQLKLDQIDADLASNRAQQNARPEELTDAERQSLELKLEELELQQELLDMIDAEATAQAEADEALLDSREKEKRLVEDIADIQRDIAQIPILEQIEEIEAARRRELEPLEEQRAVLEDQREDLDYMRQQWGFIQGDVTDALTPLREAARLQEQIARDAERAANAGGGASVSVPDVPSGSGLGVVIPDGPEGREAPEKESVKVPVEIESVPGADGDNITLDMLKPKPETLGARFGRLFADGAISRIGEVIRQNLGRIIGASAGAAIGGALLGAVSAGTLTPVGAAIGGLLGGLIGDNLQEALAERGIDLSDLTESLEEAYNEYVLPVLDRLSAFIVDDVMPAVDRFSNWLRGDGSEAATGFGESVMRLYRDYAEPAFRRITGDLIPIFMRAWERIEPTIGPALNNVGRLIRWVSDQINIHWGSIMRVVEPIWKAIAGVMEFFVGTVSNVVATVLAIIGGDWKRAWENARELFARPLGGILTFLTEMLPEIISRLSDWGYAFLNWIAEDVSPYLWDKLQELADIIFPWLKEKIPELVATLSEWGYAFLNWIAEDVSPYLWEKLQEIADSLLAWITDTALPWVKDRLKGWGSAFLDWVTEEVIPTITTKLGEISTALLNWITDTALPWIKGRLADWGSAFLDWIKEQVLGEDGLVSKLGDVARAILDWIGGKKSGATLLIKTKLVEFVNAFLDWVKDGVLGEDGLVSKLGGVLSAITGWVTDNLQTVKDSLFDVGKALLEGIEKGIRDSFDATLGKALDWAADKVPDVLKKLWGSNSPAKLFMPIGADVVRGLAVGIQQMGPTLEEHSRRLGSIVADNTEMPDLAPAFGMNGAGGYNTDLSQQQRDGQVVYEIHQTIVLDGEVIDRRIESVAPQAVNRYAAVRY